MESRATIRHPDAVGVRRSAVLGIRSLRIAFYCNLMGWPKRSHGGVRQWALALANGFAARGHDVDMLTEAPARRFRDEPRLDPRVGRIRLGIGPLARQRLLRYLRAHPGARLIAALDHYNLHAARAKRRLGSAVHVTLTQHEHMGGERAWMHPVMYRRLLWHVRRDYPCADAIIGVSRSVADDLRARPGIDPKRVHAVYNAAYRPAIEAEARQPVSHPWLGQPDHPLVLAAGRLHYVKAHDLLLDAFAAVRDATGARLMILGEGKQRRSLEVRMRRLGLAADVALPGAVPSIAPWLAACAVFVLSSRTEAMPTVLVEALALGRKIVCTNSPGGSAEVLGGGRWGRLVEVGDTAALSRALIAAVRAPAPDPEPLRRRAREFSLERALDGYLGVLGEAPAARA